MSFEEYLELIIKKIADGERVNRKEFDERMKLFFQIIGSGMSIKAARNVMDLYMPPKPESVYYPFPDEL